jgi:hypothetical protein
VDQSVFYGSATNSCHGRVKSLDADGFTLQWQQSGTGATGTVTVAYLALR